MAGGLPGFEQGSLTLTTVTGRVTLPARFTRTDHRQHRADAAAGAERP